MKDWWMHLSLREKQTVATGSFIVILFLLYEIIWSPFSNLNDSLRMHIQQNRKTLVMMQGADQLIQHLQQEMQKKKSESTQSATGILQTEINKSEFATHVTQLRQAENNSVQVNLRKVNFDALLIFLTQLWRQHGLIVSQIIVTPTGIPGEVMVDGVLSAG